MPRNMVIKTYTKKEKEKKKKKKRKREIQVHTRALSYLHVAIVTRRLCKEH